MAFIFVQVEAFGILSGYKVSTPRMTYSEISSGSVVSSM